MSALYTIIIRSRILVKVNGTLYMYFSQHLLTSNWLFNWGFQLETGKNIVCGWCGESRLNNREFTTRAEGDLIPCAMLTWYTWCDLVVSIWKVFKVWNVLISNDLNSSDYIWRSSDNQHRWYRVTETRHKARNNEVTDAYKSYF